MAQSLHTETSFVLSKPQQINTDYATACGLVFLETNLQQKLYRLEGKEKPLLVKSCFTNLWRSKITSTFKHVLLIQTFIDFVAGWNLSFSNLRDSQYKHYICISQPHQHSYYVVERDIFLYKWCLYFLKSYSLMEPLVISHRTSLEKPKCNVILAHKFVLQDLKCNI